MILEQNNDSLKILTWGALQKQTRSLLIWGGILLSLGIILGALGAHALAKVLSPRMLHAFETGVHYQLFIALALFAVAGLAGRYTNLRTPLILVRVGVVLFAGSIYLLVLSELCGTGILLSIAGPLTPLGGLCMIAGWIWFTINIIKLKPTQNS